MSKIKLKKNSYIGDRVTVKNSDYQMFYRRNPGIKKGRSLMVRLGNASMILNGKQINTIKRILIAAGELKSAKSKKN